MKKFTSCIDIKIRSSELVAKKFKLFSQSVLFVKLYRTVDNLVYFSILKF